MTTLGTAPPRSETFTPWLLEADPSGSLQVYAIALEDTYDTISQIKKLYCGEGGFDESFFDDLGIEDPEHRRLFSAWFSITALLEPLQKLEAVHGARSSTRALDSSTEGLQSALLVPRAPQQREEEAQNEENNDADNCENVTGGRRRRGHDEEQG